MENKAIVGSGNSGNFVLQNQKVGAEQGFKNVSRIWLDKCFTYEQGMEIISRRPKTEDFEATVTRFRPEVVDGKMALVDQESGRPYRTTSHCLAQLSRWAGTGTFLPAKLMASSDEQDHETLAKIIGNGLRHIDQSKPLLWRTREDGTMRAVLSDRYMTVNNQWVLETIQKILPGGRLSHWRGDEDAIYGNVLIPDNIRQEKDSDYGGMLSIGNSEIGTRHLSSLPSVFRAICMNGCIWDQTSGIAMKLRHNGQLDYAELFASMREHIHSQIPILNAGVDQLLATRSMSWSGDPLPIFAQVAQDFRVARQPMVKVLESYQKEISVSDDSRGTLFGVINAFTRAGQDLGNETWYSFDTIGGRLSNYAVSDWQKLTSRSRFMSQSSIEKILGIAV